MRREASLWLESAKEDLFDSRDALTRSRFFRAALLNKLWKKP
ncbi:MAG: hypothetical protein RMK31_01210 [Candidatus Caldarchaeum sp.]|nr:hypothetical protein [Candidatus Caldarchaeum sp.]